MSKTSLSQAVEQHQQINSSIELQLKYKKHTDTLNTKFFSETRKAKKELAEICKIVDPTFSAKILKCGAYVEKEFSLNGEKSTILRANYCKDRACPQCSQIKAQMDNLVINRTISKATVKHKLSLQFWTFSPVNVPIKYLSVMIDIISKSISHLFRNIRQYRRSIKASWITVEFKYNAILRTVNVHTHTIVGMTQDYFRKNNPDYIDVKSGKPQQELMRIMSKISHSLYEEYLHNANPKTGEIKRKRKEGLDIQGLITLIDNNKKPNFQFKNIFNGSKINSSSFSDVEKQIIKVTNYVTKYVTKIEDWIDLKGLDKSEVNPQDMAIILKILRDEILGKQLNRPTGIFRELKVQTQNEIKEELKVLKEQKFINEKGEREATIIIAFLLNQNTGLYQPVMTSQCEEAQTSIYNHVHQKYINDEEVTIKEKLMLQNVEENSQEKAYWQSIPKELLQVIEYFEKF